MDRRLAAAVQLAAQARHADPLGDLIGSALAIGREHLARGGVALGMPGGLPAGPIATAAPVAVKATPVVAPNLAHNLVRHAVRLGHPLVRGRFADGGSPETLDVLARAHALRGRLLALRPHFDDGGDADGNGGGGDNGNGNDNYGGGSNYGGYSGGAGGFGFGGIGGGVSSGSSGDTGWGSSPSSVGFGGVGDSSTTIGRATAQTGSLSNGSYSSSSYGGTYGSSPGGYGNDGSYSTGNIGPSGMAAGDGVSSYGFSGNGDASGALGFGNFGNVGLGDDDGRGYGVNGQYGVGGLGYGGNDVNSVTMSAFGYSPSPIASNVGTLGFGASSPSSGPYGGLAGFNPSTASGEASAFGGLGGFDSAGLSQDIASSPFAGYGAQGAVGSALGLGNVRGFGTFGSTTADNGVTGWASGSPTTMSSDGYNPGVAGAPASIASNDFTPGDLGVVSHSLVGTPSAPGFGQFGEADAGLGSAWGQAAPAGFGSIGQGTGYTAPSSAGVAGFGGFAAPSASVDPAAVGDTPALTVHGPASASGAVTGDRPPASLSTPEAVRNYALMDMAKNFGADYGQQYGLPSNFSFSDPARVAAVMSGAMGQESSFNPAAVNTSSLAAGLAQDLGTGMYSRNHIGSYDGLASDPSADRESAMLGAISAPSGADPASLDPRAVGVDAATAALSNLPGTYNNQEAFSLGQLATNPMYRASLDAVSDPTRSIKSAENTYTSNFEGPQAGINQATRDAIANGTYNSISNQIASLGLSSPSVTAGAPGTGYASAAPSTTTQDDVRSALGLAAGDFTPAAIAGYQNGTFSDLSLANPAASSGEDSMAPADLQAEMAKWNSPSQAMAMAAAMDSAPDPGLGMALANRTVYMSPSISPSDDALGAIRAVARQGVPSFEAGDIASNAAQGTSSFQVSDPNNDDGTGFSSDTPAVSSYVAPTQASPVTVTPGTLTPGLPAVGTTPTYMPGEKTVVKAGINAAVGAVPVVGLVNGISGLLGGPSVGGYIADHSSPGTVSQAGGQGGNGPGNARVQDTPASYLYSGSGSPATTTATSTPGNAASIATAAYNAAVAHQVKGPAAKIANPVSLIPPTATPVTYYNPLTDPVVAQALRAARGYA